jgi:hypothetical protein
MTLAQQVNAFRQAAFVMGADMPNSCAGAYMARGAPPVDTASLRGRRSGERGTQPAILDHGSIMKRR